MLKFSLTPNFFTLLSQFMLIGGLLWLPLDGTAQPLAIITTEVRLDCDQVTISFQNSSETATRSIWDVGDGQPVEQHAVSYSFAPTLDIDQRIKLIGTGPSGKSDTAVYVLNDLQQDLMKSLPSAFTPNGDSANDCWPYSSDLLQLPCAHATIFNRWGTKVWESSASDTCWNGDGIEKKGKKTQPLPVGVYFFIIKIEGHFDLSGNVTLVR